MQFCRSFVDIDLLCTLVLLVSSSVLGMYLRIAPKCSNFQNSSTVHSCSPQGYDDDLSEILSSYGSTYS
jgi:hypothetical protein